METPESNPASGKKAWQCLALLCLAWAAIYLTHLGSQELRGEEARRIVPAQEMLENGDWIVPRIAGEVYANKPPFINWVIAASFALTGEQTEWSARLPSVLGLLALAVVGWMCLRPRFGAERALFVPLATLTAIAMIDKGRTVEIEAVYLVLFGIACFLWMWSWAEGKSPWLTWTLPYLFLGLALLTKGPLILLFWALFLGFTLRFAREAKSALHPAHFVGVLLMLGIFLPWMFLNIQAIDSTADSVGNWGREMGRRIDVEQIRWGKWAARPFRILMDFLPWTLPLLFVLWGAKKQVVSPSGSARWDALAKGALWTTAVSCVVILLLPRGVPRYLMPLFPLAAFGLVDWYFRLPSKWVAGYETFARRCLIFVIPGVMIGALALGFVAHTRDLSVPWVWLAAGTILLGAVLWLLLGPWKDRSFFLTVPAVFAAGLVAIGSAILPMRVQNDVFRPAAAELNALDGHLVFYAHRHFRTGYTQHLRLLFYLEEPFTAIGESGELPADAKYLVGLKDVEDEIKEKIGDRRIVDRTRFQIANVTFLRFELE